MDRKMRAFKLRRLEDVSGVSGTGIVAEGVEFHDGQVAVSWFGRHHCIAIWNSIKDVETIHGHQGRTVVEWDEDELTAAKRELSILKKLMKGEIHAK